MFLSGAEKGESPRANQFDYKSDEIAAVKSAKSALGFGYDCGLGCFGELAWEVLEEDIVIRNQATLFHLSCGTKAGKHVADVSSKYGFSIHSSPSLKYIGEVSARVDAARNNQQSSHSADFHCVQFHMREATCSLKRLPQTLQGTRSNAFVRSAKVVVGYCTELMIRSRDHSADKNKDWEAALKAGGEYAGVNAFSSFIIHNANAFSDVTVVMTTTGIHISWKFFFSVRLSDFSFLHSYVHFY